MAKQRTRFGILAVSPFSEDPAAFKAACRDAGWKLHFAQTLECAWAILHTASVDVVITECDFPGGLCWRRLLEEMKCMRTTAPLIVCSRTANEQLWTEVLNAGGFDVVRKPFDKDELRRVIAAALASSKPAPSPKAVA